MYILYYAGTQNYMNSVSAGDLQFVQQYATAPDPPGLYEFLTAAHVLMEENNLELPTTVTEALDFYINLRAHFERKI